MRRNDATPNVFHRKFSLILIGVLIVGTAIIANSAHFGPHLRVTSGASAIGFEKTAPFLPAAHLTRPWLNVAPAVPLPPQPSVATFAGDCATPKSVFNVRANDKTVCAQVTDAKPGWRLIWSNSRFRAVQANLFNAANQSFSFTLDSNSSLGDWRVIVFDAIGGNVNAVATFTVMDQDNPTSDVAVSKGGTNDLVNAGGQALFGVQVTNNGPDAAANVHLTDATPANTSVVSFVQLTGPVFTCTTDANSTDCSIPSLNRGDIATFLGTYQVDGGAADGTEISNIANVSTTTAESNTDNNSSTSTVTVADTPCQLTCPSSITVQADSGQAGAIVNYTAPTGTGACGQIVCNIDSGSFFPVGTTTVICSGDTGPACSFQVTVENPGGLSISLSGANPLTLECGNSFTDPGASAVDASGQSVPVTVTYSQGFNPTAPTTGTYTGTYTATSGSNSTSTQRTINVADTEKPAITVDGANPYKIIQGSCLPFVDPGASATDACAGPETVTRTISGPNGLTAVDNNVPGTYTVTYSATDGSHPATATRTVLVGQFSQDEADQPAGANVPPTVTLNGDDQVTLECGDTFNDPGATASVCGHSVSVTTTGTVDVHTPGVYTITYSATANGLTSTVTRTVTVGPDNTPPNIEVLGANPMTVECHSVFTDPGATAHDACAGDFAATASGTVDPNTVGTYVITYNATDPSGHVATARTRTVNVVDTTPPTITTCPAPQTAFADANCQAVVPNFASSAVATDLCGGSAVTISQSPAAGSVVSVGVTTVTITAKDAYNNASTCATTFTVTDNTPPVITTNGQTPSMWPPNHTYQTFQVTNFVTSASDNCDASVDVSKVVIEKVTSDESENGNGSGNTLNDIVIAGDCKSVQLRAERQSDGDGRVYTITFKVTDAAGNVGRATATVVVPHNPGEPVVDSGPQYTVNGSCP